MTPVHVICGLGPPPPIKNLGYVYGAYRPGIREQELFFRNFCGLTPNFMKLRVYSGTKTFFLVLTSEFVKNRTILR